MRAASPVLHSRPGTGAGHGAGARPPFKEDLLEEALLGELPGHGGKGPAWKGGAVR